MAKSAFSTKITVVKSSKQTGLNKIFEALQDDNTTAEVNIKKNVTITVTKETVKDREIENLSDWLNATEENYSKIERYRYSGEVLLFSGRHVWLMFENTKEALFSVLRRLAAKNC